MAGRGRALRRWTRAVAGFLAALVAFPILPIAALRWIEPPTTAFMLEHRLARLVAREPVTLDYRWTGLADVAPVMALAVIAAEDQRFLEHHGLDVEAINDAIDQRERRGRLRGASTITQQVAKNLFLWPRRSFVRKGLEAYLAVLLELLWSKRRILEVYLNVAELGDGLYGVTAAAGAYFGKAPATLTRREAALLAATLPAPKHRRPDRPTAWLSSRAAWIERQMEQLGGASYLAGVLPHTADP